MENEDVLGKKLLAHRSLVHSIVSGLSIPAAVVFGLRCFERCRLTGELCGIGGNEAALFGRMRSAQQGWWDWCEGVGIQMDRLGPDLLEYAEHYWGDCSASSDTVVSGQGQSVGLACEVQARVELRRAIASAVISIGAQLFGSLEEDDYRGTKWSAMGNLDLLELLEDNVDATNIERLADDEISRQEQELLILAGGYGCDTRRKLEQSVPIQTLVHGSKAAVASL